MPIILKHARAVAEFIAGFAILLIGGGIAGLLIGSVYAMLGQALLGD
jgi:hypothetical protein